MSDGKIKLPSEAEYREAVARQLGQRGMYQPGYPGPTFPAVWVEQPSGGERRAAFGQALAHAAFVDYKRNRPPFPFP